MTVPAWDSPPCLSAETGRVGLYVWGMDALWIFLLPLIGGLVGGAAGGAVITGIFGLVKSRQDTRTEHKQWLRNERVKVYSEFLSEIKEETWKLQTSPSPQTVTLSFPVDRLARIDIVGSETVRAAALEYAQQKNGYETSRGLFAAEGSILEVPGPNRTRIADQYVQAHRRLIELGENFLEVVRKDLDTADR